MGSQGDGQLSLLPESHKASLPQKQESQAELGSRGRIHSPTRPSSLGVRWGFLTRYPSTALFYCLKASAFSEEEPVGLGEELRMEPDIPL